VALQPISFGGGGRSNSSSNTPAPRRSSGGGAVSFRQQGRKPGGTAANRERIRSTRGDSGMAAITDAQAGLAAQYDAEIARLRGSGGGGGGGGASYQSAINDALEVLRDVQGNRAAIKNVYGEYGSFIDPLHEEAIQSAIGMVAAGKPVLEGITTQGKETIASGYDSAESAVAAEAELIKAGAGAAATVVEDAIDSEALRMAAEMEQAITAQSLLSLDSKSQEKAAVASRDVDQEQMRRRARVLDLEFEDMEEQAQSQLDAARAAARAAAARASAMRRNRSAAIAELESEKAAAMRLNPHEAGEATALGFLRREAAGLDYNRQQLVVSTVGNAVSEHVPTARLGDWLKERGVPLTKSEHNMVKGALRSYTNGMLTQQSIDRRGTTPSISGAYNWRRG
jgi:hypothetical protein